MTDHEYCAACNRHGTDTHDPGCQRADENIRLTEQRDRFAHALAKSMPLATHYMGVRKWACCGQTTETLRPLLHGDYPHADDCAWLEARALAVEQDPA